MKHMNEGDVFVLQITLFPETLWSLSIPGPQVQFPVVIVHADQREQQLLPVRGTRYDSLPYLAVVCLRCGVTVVVERSDRETTPQRVQAQLIDHTCRWSLLAETRPDQYTQTYRNLVSRIFHDFSSIHDLDYICSCDTMFPNNYRGFALHIPLCPRFADFTFSGESGVHESF